MVNVIVLGLERGGSLLISATMSRIPPSYSCGSARPAGVNVMSMKPNSALACFAL